MKLFPALLSLVLLLLASAARAEPTPHSWGFGVHGDGTRAEAWGQPSVFYVVSDKTTLEVTPRFGWNRRIAGGGVLENYVTTLSVGVIRNIGARKDFRLSYYVLPGISYDYSKTEGSGTAIRVKNPGIFLNTGFQIEYFVIPDLSIAARTGLHYSHDESTRHSASGKIVNINREVGLVAEAINVNYYFGKSAEGAAKDDGAMKPAGPWALGWSGAGNLYGFWAPSFKRVLTDKTALELIPIIRYTNSTPTNGFTRNEFYGARFSIVRKLMSRRHADVSYVIEPGFSYQVFASENNTGFHARQETWNLTLGAGLEVEYFVLDNFSLGARALLVYSNEQTGTSGTFGSPYTVGHNLSLGGQSLSARWYFGGGN